MSTSITESIGLPGGAKRWMNESATGAERASPKAWMRWNWWVEAMLPAKRMMRKRPSLFRKWANGQGRASACISTWKLGNRMPILMFVARSCFPVTFMMGEEEPFVCGTTSMPSSPWSAESPGLATRMEAS